MSRKRRKKPSTLVDIAIPVLNRFDILGECLEHIPNAFGTIPYKIHIYDNGSDKKNADHFYRSLDKNIYLHRSQDNVGFPRACNYLFRKGRSPLVFFLNSDVLLYPNSMKELVKVLDDPKVGVAGMKLVFPTHEQLETANIDMRVRPAQKLQHIGIMTNITATMLHAFVGWDAEHPKVNSQSEVMAITGAALLTRRSLFRNAGMFDDIYSPGTYEDVDYCLKVREMGYNVRVNPEAVGIHYTGASVEENKMVFPLNQNHQKFLMKWNGKPQLKQWDWKIL